MLDVVVPLLGAITASLLALMAWVMLDVRRQLFREMSKVEHLAKTNGKHLDSVIQVQWSLIWRTNGIEDFLENTTDFRAPRLIPKQRKPEGNHG